MEERKAKIMFALSGGTAGKGGITNRITLPTTWVKAMGITKEDREVVIVFDEETKTITIEKLLDNSGRMIYNEYNKSESEGN